MRTQPTSESVLNALRRARNRRSRAVVLRVALTCVVTLRSFDMAPGSSLINIVGLRSIRCVCGHMREGLRLPRAPTDPVQLPDEASGAAEIRSLDLPRTRRRRPSLEAKSRRSRSGYSFIPTPKPSSSSTSVSTSRPFDLSHLTSIRQTWDLGSTGYLPSAVRAVVAACRQGLRPRLFWSARARSAGSIAICRDNLGRRSVQRVPSRQPPALPQGDGPPKRGQPPAEHEHASAASRIPCQRAVALARFVRPGGARAS
jgi:hypothetical protein